MDKKRTPQLGGTGGTRNRRRDVLRFVASTAPFIIYVFGRLSICNFGGGL